MKFKVKITNVGEMVEEFLEENMLIIFNDTAPAELAEIAVTHSGCELSCDVAVGDSVKIGDNEYCVTAVGDVANDTIRSLGHCTFKFINNPIANLPGVINLHGEKYTPVVGQYLVINS